MTTPNSAVEKVIEEILKDFRKDIVEVVFEKDLFYRTSIPLYLSELLREKLTTLYEEGRMDERLRVLRHTNVLNEIHRTLWLYRDDLDPTT